MPASRQTAALERTLRRTWIPVARNWRMTPRGLRMLQRVSEPPRRRVPILRGSVVEHLHVAGLPAEWVRGPRALGASAHGDDRAVVLYLHGGGYVFGSPRTHRNLVSRISHVTGLPTLALDYRLPPVATLPAPIEDALAAYRHLLDEGHAPERIVVAGDSAGGHLALTLALHATEAGLPAPRGADPALALDRPRDERRLDLQQRDARPVPAADRAAPCGARRARRCRPGGLALLSPVRAQGPVQSAAADADPGRLDRGALRRRAAHGAADRRGRRSRRAAGLRPPAARRAAVERARPRRAPRCARSAASPPPCWTRATCPSRRASRTPPRLPRARRRRPDDKATRDHDGLALTERAAARAPRPAPTRRAPRRRPTHGPKRPARQPPQPAAGVARHRPRVQAGREPHRQSPSRDPRPSTASRIRTARTTASRARHGTGQPGSASGPRRHSA